MKDQADVEYAPSRDMVHPACGRLRWHGAEKQEDAGENEGEKRRGGEGSSAIVTRKEMLDRLGRVEVVVVGRDDRDVPARVYKIRGSYSTGAWMRDSSRSR